MLAKIRLALSKQICRPLANEEGVISAFELSDTTYEEFVPGVEEDESYVVKIDSEFAEKLASKIIKKAKKCGIASPVLVVPMEIRGLFFSLLSVYLNNITVISREEVGYNYSLDVIASI